MLIRTRAITAAGIVLSQPTIKTRPSKRWPRVTSSIESAITSRLTSEAFIPSVPIETPSDTAMVLNSIGVPPAARIPAFTFSARRRWLKLQGMVSIQLCPTPISGLLRSSRVKPIARSMARAPARSSPSVNRALCRFSGDAPFGSGMDSPSSKPDSTSEPVRCDDTLRGQQHPMSASTTETILPEAGLRAEIRLLGQLLGETLREHEGDALYELEESIRLRTKELRQNYDAAEELALVAELGRIPLEDAARLVRAFATYFQLVNLAELERQARSLAEATDDPGELDRSIARFKAQGIPADRVAATLEQLEVRPVLTAHPTEAVRRSILDHQDRIGQELARLRAPLSARERDRVRQRIATQVEVLWHTDEVRSVRPRVIDEVGNALFYLERTFFDAVPDVQQQLVEALSRHYPGIRVPADPPIRLGSWVGSDQDGNPNANAAMLTETLRLQRRTLLTRYRERVRELARDLSQSTRLTQVSDDLTASIARDEHELEAYADSLSPGTQDNPQPSADFSRCRPLVTCHRQPARHTLGHGGRATGSARLSPDVRPEHDRERRRRAADPLPRRPCRTSRLVRRPAEEQRRHRAAVRDLRRAGARPHNRRESVARSNLCPTARWSGRDPGSDARLLGQQQRGRVPFGSLGARPGARSDRRRGREAWTAAADLPRAWWDSRPWWRPHP